MVEWVIERFAPAGRRAARQRQPEPGDVRGLRPSRHPRCDRRLRRPARRVASRALRSAKHDSSRPRRATRRSCRSISSRGCTSICTHAAPSSPSRAPATSRTPCSAFAARACCRASPRFSRAAAGKSTRGTRRLTVVEVPFDDNEPTRSATSTRRTSWRGTPLVRITLFGERGLRSSGVPANVAFRRHLAFPIITYEGSGRTSGSP